jgi:hypothetical protein
MDIPAQQKTGRVAAAGSVALRKRVEPPNRTYAAGLADDLCMSEKAIRGYGLKTIYVAGSAHNRREELLRALIK